MKKIIVTGSGGATSVGFTRCLRKAPEKMYLVGTDANETYIHFSETDKKFVVPRANSPNYIDVLNDIISKEDIEFVHAQPDIEVAVLSENRDKINANIFLPHDNTIKICQDKFRATKIWERKNVPVAKTLLISNEVDMDGAFKEIGATLWIRAIQGAGGKGSLRVNEHKHATAWIDYWNGWGKFVASEYLPGANFGWEGVFKDGELVKSFSKQRLAYKGGSPSGVGTTNVAKLTKRSDICETAMNAVYAIDKNPNGVLSVDLKENEKGIPCVTEINPGRFLTSSLHFFYMINYLMPYLYVKIAYREKIPPMSIKLEYFDISLIRDFDKRPKLIDL